MKTKKEERFWKLKEEALVRICGELTLEEFMDLIQNRLYNECKFSLTNFVAIIR